MPHDVFLSHSSENRAIANAVCARLEERKIRCWIAPRDIQPGVDYGEALAEAIDASRAMVLILTSPANQSHHVRREIERAISRGIPVIPLRTEDVALSKALQYFLGSVHWLDAVTPPLEQHIETLAEAIRPLLGPSYVAPAAIAAGPPPDRPAAPVDDGPLAAIRPASMRRRMAAFAIDMIAVGVMAAIAGFGLLFVDGMMRPDSPVAPGAAPVVDGDGTRELVELIAASVASFLAYFALTDGLGGQATPGKRAMGLQVVTSDGGRVSPGRSCIRAVGKLFFFLTSPVGLAIAATDPRRRGFHDTLAGTVVIRATKADD